MRLSIPARVNILGNPGDGNEGDFAVISAAVCLYAHAEIVPATGWQLQLGAEVSEIHSFHPGMLPLQYGTKLDLLAAALNRLHAASPELQARLPMQAFHLRVWSELPLGSGLGGSSLLVLLVLGALRAFYQLDPHTHNDYFLAELAQRIEALELGITCGYADRYVPLFGGLAYVDYRDKLQAPLGQEPYATYERLDGRAAPLNLLAAHTGIRHDSGDVHGRLRPQFMQEYLAWRSGSKEAPLVEWMRQVHACAWQGKIALLHGDLVTFGSLMDENHRLVDAMMHYCGFEEGAGWANNLLIETARQAGALGCKLTGAGGGGSVFALLPPGGEEQLRTAWRAAFQAHGLAQARIFTLEVSHTGLTIQA